MRSKVDLEFPKD